MMVAGVAVACLALGIIMGVMFSMVQTSDARQAVADSQRKVDEAEAAQERLAADRAELSERSDALDALEKEIQEREEAVADRDTELTNRENDIADAEQQAQEQQQQQEQEQQQPGGDQWWYWDCNGAREAGAAPIQQGQPGYRGSLDGNGNGVACEPGE